ncbi:aspartate aminotransferase family protein [Roseovarius aestuarii]|nr:aspartate aminotransferase family protein [Roseovarius aestuarii]
MKSRLNSPAARDTSSHLHAFTNAKTHLEHGPLIIERGDGVYVEDSQGNRYIEGMAGLWSVALGFSEQRLADAAVRQMRQLPFYHSFSHRSHGPLIDLAEKLVEMVPVPMSKAFFTNSGSEANDSALKFIWYRANAMGTPEKKKIIARDRGYHGVTVASASLTGLPTSHRSFNLPIAGILHTSCPHHWRNANTDESEEMFSTRLADELETLILAEGPETIAAFFAEPVMGAGGVIVPPATYWEKIQTVLRKYDVLLVADEVICGFGRTGRMFGCQTFGIEPDIMVLSKQLSSSYQPIAALLINDKVFEPIAEESNKIGVLGHGFTCGGHPVAAAVALENIAIIEERDLVENAQKMGARMQAGLAEFSDHPLVGEVRGVGLIAAVELTHDKSASTPPEPTGALGSAMNGITLANGLVSRNMIDTMALCPPLIISENEVDQIVQIMGASLDQLQRSLSDKI